jgi:hypothetical protein
MQLYRIANRRLPETTPDVVSPSACPPFASIRVHSRLLLLVEISQNCLIITSSPQNAGIA